MRLFAISIFISPARRTGPVWKPFRRIQTIG